VLRWILQEYGEFTWRVADCEELVGVTWSCVWLWRISGSYSQEMMGWMGEILLGG